MSDSIIKVEKLGKRYRLGYSMRTGDGHGTLGEAMTGRLKNLYRKMTGAKAAPPTKARTKPKDSNEFWALRDLSFDIKRGDVVGVIGRNGAGKSTLLKLISRITEPTEGRMVLRGRVASLLEVGTGFHPQLSGRDNIYLNGAILGMSKKEISRKFDEIVEFSGVERFLETPIKRYSSGMKVRLAFAVAAHLEPEILIVDEVLAVGDVEFQKRCLGKMQDVASSSGRTVLFVSHNMAAISQLCHYVMWLKQGSLHGIHPTSDGIRSYLSDAVAGCNAETVFPRDENLPGQILQASIRRSDGTSASHYSCSDDLHVEVTYEARQLMHSFALSFTIKNGEGYNVLFSSQRDDTGFDGIISPGVYTYKIPLPRRLLAAGFYVIDLKARSGPHGIMERLDECFGFNLEEFDSNLGTARPGVLGLLLPWQIERTEQLSDGGID